MKERGSQMNNITSSQPNSSVYTYLIQVQSLFSQYIQMKMQLDMLNNNLERANIAFNMLPTQQTLFSVQNAWNQKLSLMQQLQQKVNEIIITLVEATKLSLVAMQRAISNGDRIGIAVNESAIASICSLLEQPPQMLFIKELYKQYCITQNISIQLSDIEIRARMLQLAIPNFNRLKMIVNGY